MRMYQHQPRHQQAMRVYHSPMQATMNALGIFLSFCLFGTIIALAIIGG